MQPEPEPPPSSTQSEADELGRLPRMTRRGLAVGGATLLAGVGVWRWVFSRSAVGGLAWPLRRVLEFNESVARVAFEPLRQAPEFPRSAARTPRANGVVGLRGPDGELAPMDEDRWRLRVLGPAGEVAWSLDEIRALPRVESITELKCVEGWSAVVHWSGARLSDLAAATGLASRAGRPYDPSSPPEDLLPYVGLETPDGGYYVGLDAPSALHPQTLLCYEMNDEPLTPPHGAPLRLAIPVKYGIKNLKRIGTLRFTDTRPADYWAERGYDWYAGL